MSDDLNIDSSLVRYWRPPPHADVQTSSVPLEVVLREVVPVLVYLRSYVCDHKEVLQALKKLTYFVSNLRLIAPPGTVYAQLRAIFPIRHWLHWAPGLVEQMCMADPLAAIFQAFYHVVVIAIMPYFPAAVRSFALSERCAQIEAIWVSLKDIASSSDGIWARDVRELMEGPRSVAIHYSRHSVRAC